MTRLFLHILKLVLILPVQIVGWAKVSLAHGVVPLNGCRDIIIKVNHRLYPAEHFDSGAMNQKLVEMQARFGKAIAVHVLGSDGGLDVPAVVTNVADQPRAKIIIVAAQHGYESLSSLAAMHWLDESLSTGYLARHQIQVVMIPMANPHGVDNVSRFNSTKDDTNRKFYVGSDMPLKAWVDGLAAEYGPFGLGLDVHGTIYREGLFVLQNKSDQSGFASRALAAVPDAYLSPSDSGTYPGHRGIRQNPELYMMERPGLGTSENAGTLKTYWMTTGQVAQAFSLEYSNRAPTETKLGPFNGLIQSFVDELIKKPER